MHSNPKCEAMYPADEACLLYVWCLIRFGLYGSNREHGDTATGELWKQEKKHGLSETIRQAVNKPTGNRHLCIWRKNLSNYVKVAHRTNLCTCVHRYGKKGMSKLKWNVIDNRPPVLVFSHKPQKSILIL